MGPQALEDIPMAIMAFLVGIAAMIIFLDVTSGHLTESRADDLHNAGKRLVETISGDIFQSEVSASYGSNVLDAELISLYSNESLGSLEYPFWAEVRAGWLSWQFGQEPPERTFNFVNRVTVLTEEGLYNGIVEVKIWS